MGEAWGPEGFSGLVGNAHRLHCQNKSAPPRFLTFSELDHYEDARSSGINEYV